MTTFPSDSSGGRPAGDRSDHADTFGIVFFDGYCGLCNSFVDSILRLPSKAAFRFSPRQGETFRSLAKRFPEVSDCDSIIYLPPGRDAIPLVRSDAVIGIFLRVGGARGGLARVLRLIPRPLRDLGYRIVARLRHVLSKRRQSCRLPTPDERPLFLA